MARIGDYVGSNTLKDNTTVQGILVARHETAAELLGELGDTHLCKLGVWLVDEFTLWDTRTRRFVTSWREAHCGPRIGDYVSADMVEGKNREEYGMTQGILWGIFPDHTEVLRMTNPLSPCYCGLSIGVVPDWELTNPAIQDFVRSWRTHNKIPMGDR